MINLFDFSDYKTFLSTHLKSLPNHGHGELKKISDSLRIHPTRLSQVIRGDMNFTHEQAFDLTKYLAFTSGETEYFLCLVNLKRAGTKNLKEYYRQQLQQIHANSIKLVNRVPREKILSKEEQVLFYSGWQYSAIRLATSIKELQNPEDIAAYFKMPREQVYSIIEFLLNAGLCIETKDGITMGPKSTHLEQSSMLAGRYHANWRLKALNKHESLTSEELAYTCPVSISKKDFSVIKELLAKTIEQFVKKVVASEPAEELGCLNIDWFKI